ncbi:MAG: hypothetical protein ABIT76_12260 [Chthoniobacterales bacterium]
MKLSLCDGDYLVLSDLHIGHQASAVQNVDVLTPLLVPGRTLIFNGDTFEMRRAVDREKAVKFVADLKSILRDAGVSAVFINGNHDPVISEVNHLECHETAVLITHGDVLFHNVAPWSLNEKLYRQAHAKELALLSDEQKNRLDFRLAALRRATTSYDITHPVAKPGLAGSVVHFLETTWPPWRPLSIIQSWMEVPSRAEKFAKTYRPEMRTILIGHSHFAGIWERNGLRIINTGAAMTGFRPRAVRFEDHRISVERLVWSGGKLHLSSILASFDLAQPKINSRPSSNTTPRPEPTGWI